MKKSREGSTTASQGERVGVVDNVLASLEGGVYDIVLA